MPVSYQTAVLSEDCERLADTLVDACKATLLKLEQNEGLAVVSAALLTTMQVIDGNDMPRETGLIKPNGIAAYIAALIYKRLGR